MNAIGGSTTLRVLPGGTSREFGVLVFDAATNAGRSGVGVRFEARDAAATFPGNNNRTAHTVPTDAQGEAWTRIQPIPGGPNIIRVRATAAGETQVTEFTIQVDPNATAPTPDPVAPPPPRTSFWPAIAAMVIVALIVGGLIFALLVSKIGTANGATSTGGGTTVIKTGGPVVDATARKDARQAIGDAQAVAADVSQFKATTTTELANRPTRVESEAYANEGDRRTYRAALLADLAREDALDDRALADLGGE